MGDPELDDVIAAARRIGEHIHRTPVATCASLDEISGARLFFKCEHLQKVGAFKARGAGNAVQSLAEKVAHRGVATHSSGNHAAALARAAALRGIPAHIVMPSNAPAIKRRAVEGYGAHIVESGPTLADRERVLDDLLDHTDAVFIHPYDNPMVIAGQGTAALELIDQVSELDMVVTPLGGGGLLSGTAIACAGRSPATTVIGAEPELADDARRSLETGVLQPALPPVTIADGLRTALSPRTFRILRRHSVQVCCASEDAIVDAMRMLWMRAKLLVEASAAVPLAVVLGNPDLFAGRRVGIILSGGNVDLDHLPW